MVNFACEPRNVWPKRHTFRKVSCTKSSAVSRRPTIRKKKLNSGFWNRANNSSMASESPPWNRAMSSSSVSLAQFVAVCIIFLYASEGQKLTSRAPVPSLHLAVVYRTPLRMSSAVRPSHHLASALKGFLLLPPKADSRTVGVCCTPIRLVGCCKFERMAWVRQAAKALVCDIRLISYNRWRIYGGRLG